MSRDPENVLCFITALKPSHNNVGKYSMNKPFLTLSLPGFVADAELTGWVGGGGEERNNHYEASKVHDFK